MPGARSGCIPLYRDVESLVYALAEFPNLEINLDNDADPDFTDEDSPWNL